MEASYGVYLPSVMTSISGWFFISTMNFQARAWLWVCVWGSKHTHNHSLSWKILVSIKNHPLTLVHNRGQVYAIPCFTGKYTGWKCTKTFATKKCYWALNMVFIYALVLFCSMNWRCSFDINLFYYDAKLALNLKQICPKYFRNLQNYVILITITLEPRSIQLSFTKKYEMPIYLTYT